MKFSIKNFWSKYDEIRRKLQILSYLLKKSVMENFIFCAVLLSQVEHLGKEIRTVKSLQTNMKICDFKSFLSPWNVMVEIKLHLFKCEKHCVKDSIITNPIIYNKIL